MSHSELAKKLRSEAHDENGYGHPLTTLLLAAADEIDRLQKLVRPPDAAQVQAISNWFYRL